jgi:hypothetical protein
MVNFFGSIVNCEVENVTAPVYIGVLQGGRMATEAKAFTLRLPPELYEPIAGMAERERRSLHNQVLYLLDQALEAMEDVDAVRAYEAAKASGGDSLSLDEAFEEIEKERAARLKAS